SALYNVPQQQNLKALKNPIFTPQNPKPPQPDEILEIFSKISPQIPSIFYLENLVLCDFTEVPTVGKFETPLALREVGKPSQVAFKLADSGEARRHSFEPKEHQIPWEGVKAVPHFPQEFLLKCPTQKGRQLVTWGAMELQGNSKPSEILVASLVQ
ncbi:hypothetical protein C5167_014482, partial [Papaver somniferum]